MIDKLKFEHNGIIYDTFVRQYEVTENSIGKLYQEKRINPFSQECNELWVLTDIKKDNCNQIWVKLCKDRYTLTMNEYDLVEKYVEVHSSEMQF